MKSLIKHLLKENLKEIVNNSLLNCHCIGLHSILFTNKIRLFIADVNHELWKNDKFFNDLSVAIHPHHCNITLECVYGMVRNYTFNIGFIDSEIIVLVDKWQYCSKITDGAIGFSNIGRDWIRETPVINNINRGNSLYLSSNDFHTVWVQKGQKCAWFVYEGEENPDYSSICYSNTDLNKFDSSQLYQKATKSEIIRLLKLVNLI